MSVSVTSDWPTSPFAAADAAFARLNREPAPMTLDLDIFDADLGLPSGAVTLTALRRWLLKHPHAYAARDAVWRELVRRARLDDPAWVVAAVGMAMPALVRHAAALAAGYRGERDDIDAEVLTGFLTALRDRVDLGRPAPYAGLCMAAWRAGKAFIDQDARYLPTDDVEVLGAGSRSPKPPYGHPDLLVRRAVQLGILNPEDEQPYIDIRLGGRAIEPIAARLGIRPDALRMRLSRIDTRITQALAEGLLTDVVSAQEAQRLARQAYHRARTRAAQSAARRPGTGSAPAARAA